MKATPRENLRDRVVRVLQHAQGNVMSHDAICERVRLDPKHVRDELDVMRREGLIVRVGSSTNAPWRLVSTALIEAVPAAERESANVVEMSPTTPEGILALAKEILAAEADGKAAVDAANAEVAKAKEEVVTAMGVLSEAQERLDAANKSADAIAAQQTARLAGLMSRLPGGRRS